MISIKDILYGLKKRYGVKADFYQQSEETVDILTGKRSVSRKKYSIRRAVYLKQNQGFRNVFLPKANPIIPNSGLIEVDDAELLIAGKDFPKGFTPTFDDYVMINHQRYEIKSIHIIDKDQSYYFILHEYKGTVKYEIHERYIQDDLQLIHVLRPRHLIQWTVSLDTDQLFLTDNLTINYVLYNRTFIDENPFQEMLFTQLFSNNIIRTYIGLKDKIDFTDQMSYDKVFIRTLTDTISFIDVVVRDSFINVSLQHFIDID